MAFYTYRGLNISGKVEKGTLQASSSREVQAALEKKDITPLKITLAKKPGFKLSQLRYLGTKKNLPTKELGAFSRKMALLLESTLPYDVALGMILQQTTQPSLKEALSEIQEKVAEGAYLADAMDQSKIFPSMMSSMMRAGESSGTLVSIMHQLADYYENLAKMKSKLTSVMVYPLFMTVFSLAITLFMLVYVVPKITALFDNFGVRLPWMTRFLIEVSGFLVQSWWVLLLVVLVFLLLASAFLRRPYGKNLWHKMELKIPLWGSLRRKILIQRFTQTLSIMLQSGVELYDSLEVCKKVLDNGVYISALDRVMFEIKNQGVPFTTALHNTGLFPEDVSQIIAIGEETASLDKMLENVGRRLDQEVGAIMDGASSLLEPVLILVMGGVVGFIVMAILLPMLQLNQLVR